MIGNCYVHFQLTRRRVSVDPHLVASVQTASMIETDAQIHADSSRGETEIMASVKKPMSPSEFFAKIYGDKNKDSDSNDSTADASAASTPPPPTTPWPAAVYPPPSLLFGTNWPSSLWSAGESAATHLYQHLELPPALTALSIHFPLNYNLHYSLIEIALY